jgi:hypothetical protein
VSALGEGSIARPTGLQHPIARDEGLLVEHVGDETVVYDRDTKDAHCLTPLAAAVFAHCDGKSSIGEIATLASDRLDEPVDEASVSLALAHLEERNLLQRDLLALEHGNGNGYSRRQMIRKGAVVAGAAASVPLISSIAAPTAAMAASLIPTGCGGCGQNKDCASNHCCQNNAGKQCNQSCCVGANNSCHACGCDAQGHNCQCTVAPGDIGTPCPCVCGELNCTGACCVPGTLCCTPVPLC